MPAADEADRIGVHPRHPRRNYRLLWETSFEPRLKGRLDVLP
jgi:hypothetical protein